MRDFAGKRYWLVGASEGLGAALAHGLSRMGAEVVLSARNADRLTELAAELPGRAQVVPVDVADDASVKEAAKAVGEIDGVVFLAAIYWPMKSTEWDADKATLMTDVNYTGCVRIMGAVMPGFVARDAGHIVITGSLSGFRGLPGAIGYGPSKAAVMALAESMHADLHNTGIDVQLVNPGYIKTRLTEKNDFTMPFIMEPEDAAQAMLEHMGSDRFKRSFPRVFSWLFRGSQFLPDWLYYRVFGTRG